MYVYFCWQHVEELLRHFDSVVLDLAANSQDYQDAAQVLEALQECLRGGSGKSTMRCSADSGISRGSGSMTTRSLSQTSVNMVYSMDAEMAALQNKLLFPRRVRVSRVLCRYHQNILVFLYLSNIHYLFNLLLPISLYRKFKCYLFM